MEQGDLGSFYSCLRQERLPKSYSIKNYRYIFLDTSGPGKGGPNFRTGKGQLRLPEKELAAAQLWDETNLLFMHTYLNDLIDSQEKSILNRLIAKHDVALVDMGHTQYNELANDGQKIFAATRSTGQIEEGPLGYSLITVQNDIVSWRFKQLQDPFPFVIITAPADYRLIRNEQQFVQQRTEIAAVVYSLYPVGPVYCQVNNNEKVPMLFNKNTNSWYAVTELPDTEFNTIIEKLLTRMDGLVSTQLLQLHLFINFHHAYKMAVMQRQPAAGRKTIFSLHNWGLTVTQNLSNYSPFFLKSYNVINLYLDNRCCSHSRCHYPAF